MYGSGNLEFAAQMEESWNHVWRNPRAWMQESKEHALKIIGTMHGKMIGTRHGENLEVPAKR